MAERLQPMPVLRLVGLLNLDPDMEEFIQITIAEYGVLLYALYP